MQIRDKIMGRHNIFLTQKQLWEPESTKPFLNIYECWKTNWKHASLFSSKLIFSNNCISTKTNPLRFIAVKKK